jgi:hypothetical protein
MMPRPVIVILLLTALSVATIPTGIVFADLAIMQGFDRNACYATCPCDIPGMEEACADCKQKCDREFWKEFDKETENGDGGRQQ